MQTIKTNKDYLIDLLVNISSRLYFGHPNYGTLNLIEDVPKPELCDQFRASYESNGWTINEGE